jgi:hypothetical protein
VVGAGLSAAADARQPLWRAALQNSQLRISSESEGIQPLCELVWEPLAFRAHGAPSSRNRGSEAGCESSPGPPAASFLTVRNRTVPRRKRPLRTRPLSFDSS